MTITEIREEQQIEPGAWSTVRPLAIKALLTSGRVSARFTMWTIHHVVEYWPRLRMTFIGIAVGVMGLWPLALIDLNEYGLLAGAALGVHAVLGIWGIALRRSRYAARRSITPYVKARQQRHLLRRHWASSIHRSKLDATPYTDREKLRHGDTKMMPKLHRRIRRTPVGLKARVDGSRLGHGPDAFKAAVPALKTSLGCLDIFPRDVPGKPRLTELSFVWDDPFETVFDPRALPSAEKPLHVVAGPDAEGFPVELALYLPLLLIGAKGSGKSSLAWLVLRGLLLLGIPVRVWVYDPKNGQEFPLLNGAAYHYAREPSECKDFLTRLLSCLIDKQERMGAAGYRKWSPDCGEPFDVVVIDELIEFKGMLDGVESIKVESWEASGKGKDSAGHKAFNKVMSQSRSGGLTLIAGAQQPQKEVIGVGRDQFDTTVCLRVTSIEQAKIVFGEEYKAYRAHELPIGDENAGIGFIDLPGRGWTKFRAAFVDDTLREEIAAEINEHSVRYREDIPEPRESDENDPTPTPPRRRSPARKKLTAVK